MCLPQTQTAEFASDSDCLPQNLTTVCLRLRLPYLPQTQTDVCLRLWLLFASDSDYCILLRLWLLFASDSDYCVRLRLRQLCSPQFVLFDPGLLDSTDSNWHGDQRSFRSQKPLIKASPHPPQILYYSLLPVGLDPVYTVVETGRPTEAGHILRLSLGSFTKVYVKDIVKTVRSLYPEPDAPSNVLYIL